MPPSLWIAEISWSGIQLEQVHFRRLGIFAWSANSIQIPVVSERLLQASVRRMWTPAQTNTFFHWGTFQYDCVPEHKSRTRWPPQNLILSPTDHYWDAPSLFDWAYSHIHFPKSSGNLDFTEECRLLHKQNLKPCKCPWFWNSLLH